MGFKPITLGLVGAYQECLRQDHDGHTLSQTDFDIVSACFQETFVEDAPPDPPDPATCANGYRGSASPWWEGYCCDEPLKFTDIGGAVGVMKQNADGVRRFDEGPLARGSFAFEVFFATGRVPQGRGGLHLGCLTSAHKAWNSPIGLPQYKGWCRPDWQFVNEDGTNAELRIGLYIADENGQNFRVLTWNTGFILRPQVWIPFAMRWDRRSPTELLIGFRSGSHVVEKVYTVYPGCELFRGWKFGNMDELDLDGGTPEVRFRNVEVVVT